jgi:predicted site-specific integrase-resolvase
MANDKSNEVRISLLEYHMESVLDIVKEIRDNYVTKAELKVILDERLSHFATKEDLERVNQSLRNWVITVVLSTTALQFAMQYAMFQLYIR